MAANKRPKILALDLGFSSLKYSYINDEGLMVNEKIISAVAKLPNAPLEADDDNLFQLGGNWYVIGHDALKVNKNYLMKLETFDDLKAVYPVWLSYMFKKFSGVKWDKVAIGISMAFSDRVDELLEHIHNSLMIDPKEELFACFPQGLACKAAYNQYGVNIRDNAIHAADNKLQNFLIVDAGQNTLDISLVINNKSSAGATLGMPDTGCIWMARTISEYIYKNFEFRISLKEAQTVIDSGRLVRRGRDYDLTDVVYKIKKQYMIMVLNLIEEKCEEELNVAEALLLLGGGAYTWNIVIQDPEFVKEVEKHFPVNFVKAPADYGEYYNSCSYLLLAENILKKKKG